MPKVEESHPKVTNYGYYKNTMKNNWGVDVGLTFDMSLGYTMPYYSLL